MWCAHSVLLSVLNQHLKCPALSSVQSHMSKQTAHGSPLKAALLLYNDSESFQPLQQTDPTWKIYRLINDCSTN